MWIFKPKDDDLIYIENTSKAKVLGATSDGKVILEDFEEGKAHQLWKKGELDAEDYFTLENSGVPKVLTAISESSLEIKGNITMRWIYLVDYLLIIYHVVVLHTDPSHHYFSKYLIYATNWNMVLITLAFNFDAVMVMVRYIIEQKSKTEDYNQHYHKCHLLLKVSMALTGCRINSE